MRRISSRTRCFVTLLSCGAALSAGCTLDQSGTQLGTGASSATSTSEATTTTSGTSTSNTTTGTGGAGGMGGMGGSGGAVTCTPGEAVSCYDGPAGSEGVGPCVAGMSTCNADGMGYGPCVGQVVPATEDCATAADDDCDGSPNQAAAGCVCNPGDTQACYSGPAATQGVGVCVAGSQDCDNDGMGWGPCTGEVVPIAETCNTPGDDDCDGMTNEDGVGCNCLPGTMQACYSGPVGTQNNGPCVGGMQACNAQGTGYGVCMGEVLPGTEDCDAGLVDEDCDGMFNESGASCVCLPSSTAACYTGPMGTQNVGICAAGSHTCDALGLSYSACMGEVLPGTETCDLGLLDEDCDNLVNESGAGCVCTPNAVTPCYNGPGGTLGVGICAAGNQTCNVSGTALGACVGEVIPGVEDCTVAVDENCDGINPACAGTHVWSSLFGDSASQQGNGIAFDGSGNVLLTGQFTATVNFGGGAFNAVNAGKFDMYLAKFSAAGVHQWSKELGENGKDEYGLGVAADSAGNSYYTGYYNGNSFDAGGGALTGGGDQVFVLKFDSAGNHLWSKGAGDGDDQRGLSIALDANGDVFVTGYFEKALNLGGTCSLTNSGNTNTNIDIFVAKLSGSNGNCLWAKKAGDGSNQTGTGVAVDTAGDVYVTGTFAGAINFGTNLTSAGGNDAFLVKLSGSTGTEVWAKKFGDASGQNGQSVAANASRVLVSGMAFGSIDLGGGAVVTAGGGDAFVASYGIDGSFKWQKVMGDASAQSSAGVTLDPAGNPLIIGAFAGTVDFGGGALTSAGGDDIYLAKFSTAGTYLWAKKFGDGAAQRGLSVATDSIGNTGLTGLVNGTTDFGGGALTSAGSDDIFAAVLSP